MADDSSLGQTVVSVLVDVIISHGGEEFWEIGAGHQLLKDASSRFHSGSSRLGLLLLDQECDQLFGYGAAIGQLRAVLYPLPDLRTANLGGSGVFHQVVNGNATRAAEPGLEILQSHIDVPAQTLKSDFPFRNREEVFGGDGDGRPHGTDLVRLLHAFVKNLFSDGH